MKQLRRFIIISLPDPGLFACNQVWIRVGIQFREACEASEGVLGCSRVICETPRESQPIVVDKC